MCGTVAWLWKHRDDEQFDLLASLWQQANKFERPLGFFHSDIELVTCGQLLLYFDISLPVKLLFISSACGCDKVAYKNGIASEVTGLTVNVNRCVAVRYTLGGDNYDTSRTLTIYEQTAGAGYQYYDGVWHNITFTNGEFSLNVSSNCTIKIKGTKDSWESSGEISVAITVGKNMCYIGQAAALSSETDIKARANAYKQDTLVGSTKEVDCGSTAEYVWICIPNTAARNLTVKNGGFAVPKIGTEREKSSRKLPKIEKSRR